MWADLERAIVGRFGATVPRDKVFPIYGVIGLRYPGLCVLQFERTRRPRQWRYCTMGFSQPSGPGDRGGGSELLIETPQAERWPLQLLAWAVHWASTGVELGSGVACGAAICQRADGTYVMSGPNPQMDVPFTRLGNVGGLLIFPCVAAQGPLQTEHGPVALETLTFVPPEDLRLASQSSVGHVVLLAHELGVGQVSQLERKPLLAFASAKQRWRRILKLKMTSVAKELSLDAERFALLRDDDVR